LEEGKFVLERRDFDSVFQSLHATGYKVIDPGIVDDAVVYTSLNSANELPAGWTDEQNGGTYGLKRRDDEALFGYSAALPIMEEISFYSGALPLEIASNRERLAVFSSPGASAKNGLSRCTSL
jgi:hypothetical protein